MLRRLHDVGTLKSFNIKLPGTTPAKMIAWQCVMERMEQFRIEMRARRAFTWVESLYVGVGKKQTVTSELRAAAPAVARV